jgi:hypothetical protein
MREKSMINRIREFRGTLKNESNRTKEKVFLDSWMNTVLSEFGGFLHVSGSIGLFWDQVAHLGILSSL